MWQVIEVGKLSTTTRSTTTTNTGCSLTEVEENERRISSFEEQFIVTD